AGLLVRLARIVVRIDLPETAGRGEPVGIEPRPRGPPFGREEMKLKPVDEKPVAIIGAGPAGLTAAYLLSKEGIPTTVLEADPHLVGGIARTASYRGFHFDIGGHRFFSKSKEVEDLWTELLPKDLLERPRSSRIYYRGKFFSYPLKAVEALLKLGVLESILCVLSYLKARL